MIYLKWLLLVPIDLLMKVVGLVFAPLISLFVDEEGYLPKLLSWFSTPDSNMFGKPGDRGFYEEHKDKTDSFMGRWIVCTKWQWRNTSQGFSTYTLGAKDKDTRTVWESGEGDLVKYFKLAGISKTTAFEFKGALKWPFVKKRFRWRLGWKLQWDERFPAQFVFSISPFMSMEE